MRSNRPLIWEFSLLIVALVALCAVCRESRSSVSADDKSPAFVEANAGRVYAQAGPGHFLAFDAETGSVLWDFRDENLRQFTRAAFGSEGLFIAATGSNSNSELVRLNPANGKLDWRVPIEGLGGNGAPVLCGSEVLVSDYWHRTVSAYDVATGKNDWKTESLPLLFLFPPAVFDSNALFLVADKNEPETKQQLVSVSCKDGQLGKTLRVQIDGVSRTPVLLYQDTVVLSGYDRARGTSLKAISRTDGAQLWSALIPDEIARFTPSIQSNFLVAGALSLWVLDLDTGKTVFHEALPTASVSVAVGNGLVFLSRGKQTVEAREIPSGKLRWSAKLRGRISSNIAVTDSHVYVKTSDAQLAVLRMTGEVDRYLQIARPGGPSAASH
jgi:outer membrane protein assembly factor BamB